VVRERNEDRIIFVRIEGQRQIRAQYSTPVGRNVSVHFLFVLISVGYVDNTKFVPSLTVSLQMAPHPPVGQGLLTVEASRSHSDTPHSGNTPLDEGSARPRTSTWQHTTLTTDIHAPAGIRTRNPNKRAAADPRLRTRSHWDRLIVYTLVESFIHKRKFRVFHFYLFSSC
jgi:hypothetical protein